MEITTKELRIQPGKIIDQVVHGEEVTVTFRGKALARIVPIRTSGDAAGPSSDVFGMWADTAASVTVDETVRSMRSGRQF